MELVYILKCLVVVIVAYLLGSISWAYVIGRLATGIDMTEVGDGRIGASFAIRRLGVGWGIAVGVLDFFKGAAAVALPMFLNLPIYIIFFCALAVVAGHNWSIFLGFKGGRGAAASFGVLAVMAPLAAVIPVALMAVPFLATRKSVFIGGIRRTTLLYGIYLALVSLIVWLDIALDLLPVPSWLRGMSLLVVVLPPCLMLLNLAGRPQARKRFDNHTPVG